MWLKYNADRLRQEKQPTKQTGKNSRQIPSKDTTFSVSSRNITETPPRTEGNYALSDIKCHP